MYIYGTAIEVIKGDTRSLYSSYGFGANQPRPSCLLAHGRGKAGYRGLGFRAFHAVQLHT